VQVREAEKLKPRLVAWPPAPETGSPEGRHSAHSANPSHAGHGIRALAQVAPQDTSPSLSAMRCLTPHSSRGPTAKHQARATVQFIICSAGLAFCCRSRLSSNVRPREKHQLMRLLAPSPALMNASLRPQGLRRRAAAATFTGSSVGSLSQAQTPRFGRPQWSSRLSEGASRQQPIQKQRQSQACTGIKPWKAQRARCFSLSPSSHPARLQEGGALVVRRGLRPGSCSKSARSGTAWPNPSLKLSPNSKTPGPRCGACHHPQRGPGVLLPAPA
jgi:hypothetical protein